MELLLSYEEEYSIKKQILLETTAHNAENFLLYLSDGNNALKLKAWHL